MSLAFLVTVGVGIVCRIWLADSPVADWLTERNEVTTPLTSWKRVTEGLSLHNSGISPYVGDIFHELVHAHYVVLTPKPVMPLMLRFLNYFNNILQTKIYAIFILADIITALILERIAKYHGRCLLSQQKESVKDYSVDCAKLLLKADSLAFSRFYVILVYLLHPYSIASCLAKSTAVFNNLAISAAILATLKGQRGWACFFIAVAAYLSFYPIMLIVPAAIYFAQRDVAAAPAGNEGKSSVEFHSYIKSGVWLLACCTVLLYVSFVLEGSWRFLGSTYGFILTVPDFSPNIGVFWYFFAEMFEHFRLFFVIVFQINVFIYTIPLAIRLKQHPLFFMYTLVALIAIFKSYPSYADASLYLSMLPLWKFVFPYMRNSFVVSVMFGVCSVLAPILYHLWIYAGSANANFYFAITLVYSTAQIFLITDLLFGFLRREFDLYNGKKYRDADGKPWPVLLE